MERGVAILFGLYIIYYIVFPVTIIAVVWWIWEKKNALIGGSAFSASSKKGFSAKECMKEIRRLQVFLVLFILLSIPMMNFTSSRLSDMSMDRDRYYYGAMGQSRIFYPVDKQIGPNSDTDWVIEQMEEDPEYWYLEDIQEQLDLEKVTRLPGRLVVYRLEKRDTRWSHIVINYHYFSPLPVIRVFGFWIYEDGEINFAELEVDKTVVYPLDPAGTDPF